MENVAISEVSRAEWPNLIAALEKRKPYFGNAMHANQGHERFVWFKPTYDLVATFIDPPIKLLEVGSWAGASLVAWWAVSGRTAILEAVDKWEPYFDPDPRFEVQEEMNRVAKSGDIFNLFWHNVRTSGISPNMLTVHQGDSRDILPLLDPQSYGIVFIDCNHQYSFTKIDIPNGMKLVQDGGVLCGDDLARQLNTVDGPKHRKMVEENWPFGNAEDGEGYHPGVTQAVWEAFKGPVSSYQGFWAMQKIGDSWRPVLL
jgi:hypothetical protein